MNNLKWKVLWRKKGLWNFAREKNHGERGELPKEEGDAAREYKSMHDENFLSSWLREDGREKEERTAKVREEKEEEQIGESQKKM